MEAVHLAWKRRGWGVCQETFCTQIPGVKAVRNGRKARKRHVQGSLSEKRVWDQSERERVEREKLSRRLSEQSLTAGLEGQMSLELKNFLCQKRTPHTSGRQGLCKNMHKKKKRNNANFLYATVASTFHYGTCSSLVHKTSLEIFWPSCIFHGRKSADRVVPAKILSSGVCCLNHTASEKQNQQLQVLKDIF